MKPSAAASAFVEYVTRRVQDPAVRGTLRHVATRPYEAQVLVAPFDNVARFPEDVLVNVAAWIARFDPEGDGTGNLGHACARAVDAGTARASAVETRLLAICRSRRDQLVDQLPRLLSVCSHAPDWAGLLDDLAAWDRRRDRIAASWLAAYYRSTAATAAVQPGDPDGTPNPNPAPEDLP